LFKLGYEWVHAVKCLVSDICKPNIEMYIVSKDGYYGYEMTFVEEDNQSLLFDNESMFLH